MSSKPDNSSKSLSWSSKKIFFKTANKPFFFSFFLSLFTAFLSILTFELLTSVTELSIELEIFLSASCTSSDIKLILSSKSKDSSDSSNNSSIDTESDFALLIISSRSMSARRCKSLSDNSGSPKSGTISLSPELLLNRAFISSVEKGSIEGSMTGCDSSTSCFTRISDSRTGSDSGSETDTGSGSNSGSGSGSGSGS